jgi:tetratricopeptide (TPR) repeat protein
MKTPAWIVTLSRGALILAPLGFFGCYGADAEDASDDTSTEVSPETPAVVLTPADEAEYVNTVEQSRQLLDQGDAHDGLAVLERSAQLNPDSFAVHNNFCVAYGMLALREQAIPECQRALEIDPNSQLAKNNLNWVSGLKPAVLPE